MKKNKKQEYDSETNTILIIGLVLIGGGLLFVGAYLKDTSLLKYEDIKIIDHNDNKITNFEVIDNGNSQDIIVKDDSEDNSQEEDIKVTLKGIQDSEVNIRFGYIDHPNIRTEVIGADVNIKESTITLEKKGNVNAIYKCHDFNVDEFSCNSGWERTDIQFIDNGDSITFTVDSFSGFAGGGGTIEFVDPTPEDNANQTETWVEINVSIDLNQSDLTKMIYNWNGTNYSYYDNNLILMMNFDNLSILGEKDYGIDNKTTDISIYGNNGTIYGAEWQSEGRYNGAFYFDRQLKKITVPDSQSLNFSNEDFSIFTWVYPKLFRPTYALDQNAVIYKTYGGRYYVLGFQRDEDDSANLSFIYNAGSGENTIISNGGLLLNQWYHLGAVRNNNRLLLYLNGNIVANESITVYLDNQGVLTIGGGDWNLNSSIDEVRIWNKSFTKDEVFQQYSSNLNKYDTDKWLLYVNQSKNSTEGLSAGSYSYQAFASDSESNQDATEAREIIINSFAYPNITNLYLNATSELNSTRDNITFHYDFLDSSDENPDQSYWQWYINNRTINGTTIYSGESYNVGSHGNVNPNGIAYGGGFLWVTDYSGTDRIYKYYTNGSYTGFSFSASQGITIQGIEYIGGDLWVHHRDPGSKVFKYYTNGTYSGFNIDTSSDSCSGYGITYVNDYLLLADCKYYTNGTFIGKLTGYESYGAPPYGQCYANGYLWNMDYSNKRAYQYKINSTNFIFTGKIIDFSNEVTGVWALGITYHNGYFYVTDDHGDANSQIIRYHASALLSNYTRTGDVVHLEIIPSTSSLTAGWQINGSPQNSTYMHITGSTPQINFTSPTPDNKTKQNETWVNINVSIKEDNLNEIKYNWDGTNYTMFSEDLVLMYNFDSISSLGDNATNVAELANGLDATIVGTTGTNTDAPYGKSMWFESGGGNYLYTPDNAMFNFGEEDFAIEFWWRTSNINTGAQVILAKGDLQWISVAYNHDSDKKMHMLIGDNGATNSNDWINFGSGTKGTTTIEQDRWYHVFVNRKNNAGNYNYTLYLDSNVELGYTTSSNINYPAHNLEIGANTDVSQYLHGLVDEFRIWKRSFTSKEVKQHYMSNLNKYDLNNWSLIINQTGNSPLTPGNYTYQACASDINNDENCTETRTIEILDTSEKISPKINFTNPTPGNDTNLQQTYIDVNFTIEEANLDQIIYEWNGTNYTILNDNLLLAYNFDNIDSLGESATAIKDFSGNNLTGTSIAVGDTAPVPTTDGKYGGAFFFDGNSECCYYGGYINVSNSVTNPVFNFNTDSSFSVEAWYKVRGFSDSALVSKKTYFNTGDGWYIYFYAAGSEIGWQLGDGQDNGCMIRTTTTLDEWHHAVGVYDGSTGTAYFYHNNILIGSDDSVSFTSNMTLPITIGTEYSRALGYFFNGTIDEVRVWNKALSATEVAMHYNSNIKKYDTDKYNFYINQKNDFTDDLSLGTYTVKSFATDSAGNKNATEKRYINIIMPDARIGLKTIYPLDDINVTKYEWFNASVNITCLNENCGLINVSLDPESTLNLGYTNIDADIKYGSGSDNGGGQQQWTDFDELAGNTIIEAQWCLENRDDESSGFDKIIWLMDENVQWNEASSTSVLNSQTKVSNVTATSSCGTQDCLACHDVTELVQYAVDRGYENMTFRMEVSGELLGSITYSASGDGLEPGLSNYWVFNDREGNEGNVRPSLNITYLVNKGIITTNPSTTRFWTNSTNPATVDLSEGESIILNFWVNASETVLSTTEFYFYANLTRFQTISNISDRWNVTVEGYAPRITLNKPTEDEKVISSSITFNWSIDHYENCTCNLSVDGSVVESEITSPNYGYTTQSYSVPTAGLHNWSVHCVDSGRYSNISETIDFRYSPAVSVELYEPTSNANFTKNKFTKFVMNVSCNDYDCGDINVYLDPIAGCDAGAGTCTNTCSGPFLLTTGTSWTYNSGYCMEATESPTIFLTLTDSTCDSVNTPGTSDYDCTAYTEDGMSSGYICPSYPRLSRNVVESDCVSYQDTGSYVKSIAEVFDFNDKYFTGECNVSNAANYSCAGCNILFSDTTIGWYYAADWFGYGPTCAAEPSAGVYYITFGDTGCDSFLPAGDGECSVIYDSGNSMETICPSYARKGSSVSSSDCNCLHDDDVLPGLVECTSLIYDRFNFSEEYFAGEAGAKGGLISTTPGTIPFYTNASSNPLTINLAENTSQLVTFWVNSTGTDQSSFDFFGYASLASDSNTRQDTSTISVTVDEVIYPTYDEFKDYSGTTIFNELSSIYSVTNPTLKNVHARIKFLTTVNVEALNFDQHMEFGKGFVYVNTTGLGSNFNTPSEVSIEVDSCNDRILYYSSGNYQTRSEIIANGQVCNATTTPYCTDITCVNNQLNFTAPSFSGYAVGDNANLTIYDELDGSTYVCSSLVTFYANYTSSSGHIPGAECNITFSWDATEITMTDNGNNYEASHALPAGDGGYEFYVNCSAVGYDNLKATDPISCTQTGSSTVPEFGTIGLIMIVLTAVLGLYINKKRKV